MGRPQSSWAKFRLLMWKNWTLQKRHKVQTVMELLLPLIFTSLLVLIRSLTDATNYPDPTLYQPYSVDKLPYNMTHNTSLLDPLEIVKATRQVFPDGVPDSLREQVEGIGRSALLEMASGAYSSDGKIMHVGYTPNATLADSVMSIFERRLSPNVRVQGFSSESELVDWLEESSTPLAQKRRIGGIVFQDDMTSDFGSRISFKVRPHVQSVVQAFKPPALWYTSLQYPAFQMLGPREKSAPVGGNPGYFINGFLAMQHAVSAAITEHISGQEVTFAVNAERVPYPSYNDDQFLVVLQGWLPLVIMLSFIYPSINIVKNIVVEKERRLKESMKMMGLPNWIHWMAWWAKSFVQLVISIGLMTLLVVVDWYRGPEGEAVLSRSDPSVIFVFLLLYTITSIAFCFMISTWFSKANSAATAAGVLFFVLFIPYDFLYLQYQTMQLNQKIGACIMGNTAMGFGGMLISMWEGTGEGMQWSNINIGVSPDDNFKMSHIFAMFVADTVLYLMVAWYVEAVFPGEYGIPQPWYFPFTSHYWMGSAPSEVTPTVANNNTIRADFFEHEPTDIKAGVQIRELSKVFSNGKMAVDHMSLNMYEGQITALLGHNGAGKTTTMSMLVGLFPASWGTALINGYDIRTDTDEVRSSLGICPQHDVLFDELTVAEHIRFFCMMKGYDGDYRDEINKMLKTLELEDKRHAQAHTLSGGMKRKLSVGVALCGESKVVLLDEPTSGMDPSARRSTWDLLQRERAGRTLVLTTHFMEEADLLGDRIAIMADGKVQCCGSSLFLKRKYGAGYHMVIVKEEGCNVDKITNTIQRFISDITYDQNIGAELSYVLPNEASSKFEELFTVLDENREELKVSSYGASITTMEEVFIRVGEQSNPKVQAELKQRSEARNGGTGGGSAASHGIVNDGFMADVETPGAPAKVDMEPTLASVDTGTRRTVGFVLLLQQFRAMMVKKALYSLRNWLLTLVQIILPIFFLVMALLVLKSFPGLADDPPLELTLSNYDSTVTPVWVDPGSPEAADIATYINGDLSATTDIDTINTSDFDNMTEYLLQKAEKDLPGFNKHYIAAVDLVQGGGASLNATAVFNNEPFHASGAAMQLLDEVLLRYFTRNTSLSFRVTNHPTPISDDTKIEMQLNGQSNGFNIAFNVAFGVSFLAASYVLFLVKEMATKAKHLQFVSGVGITVFWLANLVWDYLTFLLPAFGMMITLLIFNEEGFIEGKTQGSLLMLFVMYGYSMLPQSYLFSFLFTVPSSGFTRVTLFNIFTGMATMVTVAVLRIPVLDLVDVANVLDWVFMVLPNYGLGMAMADIYSNYQGIKYCAEKPEIEKICLVLKNLSLTNPCCKNSGNCGDAGCVEWSENYLSVERLGIGRTLLFMFAEGTICLIILCLIELRVVDRIKYLYNTRRNTYGKLLHDHMDEEDAIVPELDSDVAAEKKRIQNGDIEALKHENVLVIKDLTKFYAKNFLAVDRLCLAVPKGECFGLLGINGAGKTTTFKMLTGDELISWGDAFLMGKSVRSDVTEVHRLLGYCPQFDAVIDQLTGRETLQMFARLRGIHEEDIPGVVEQLAAGLFLSEYIDKQVREYSGGNKRKLSTAVALVGDPPIVFLDEPTTGMDPVARRLLWDVICRIRAAGRSIILTSHSMEECEALCTRLAIMVNGEFRCMGSPQHLKSKFGQGYTLLIKVKVSDAEKQEFSKSHQRATSSSSITRQRPASVGPLKRTMSASSSVQPVKDFVEKSFPGSVLKDVHQGLLNYQITDASLSWARIFGMMERAKDRLNIEDYSVGQTTLEQVFLNFAKGQRPEDGE
ncbi:ATP-binding cassette sub-family A member 3-like [Pollicipes pollicipes]|uniref:ATP-binding cassette sub-family A member 3-like n=1 Tax=Pollicipes pollicipes TaxID=41117 RepID=UPI001884A375|nr:ATP-binding cassette sub-family A member 3-like [Pollicipes pollicipes]